MTAPWTSRAEQSAASAWELGTDIAAAVAEAWKARCLPQATRSLLKAAAALTEGDALRPMPQADGPSPSMDAFLTAGEELQSQAAVQAGNTRAMTAACASAREAAIAEYETARHAAAAAQAHLAAPETAAAARAAIAAADERMQAMAMVITDCEAALDLAVQVLGRLDYTITCFYRFPDELAQAYDKPLEFIRDGGTLPWSGDFLTAPPERPATIMNGSAA